MSTQVSPKGGAPVGPLRVDFARCVPARKRTLAVSRPRWHFNGEFRAASFDAVVSFYAIFHLPREQHEALFERIHGWLKPRGYLMASLAFPDEEAYTEDFFGAEMYWSNYGLGEYEAMLGRSGFELIARDTLSHGYDGEEHKPESHPLVLARKTG